MKVYKSKKYLLLILLILSAGLFWLQACKTKEQDCFQSVIALNYTYFKARDFKIDTIKSSVDTSVHDTVMVAIFNDTVLKVPEFVYIKTAATDSSYGVYSSQVRFLPTPLDPAKDSIKYRFRPDTAVAIFDTITYYYEPVTHFINNACGYTYYYTLSAVKTTNHMLDSAAVITPLVTGSNTSGIGNVNLYFKLKP